MIDLRSDTVTEPTAAMIEAMTRASWGDDSRDGDATVRRLEAYAAELVGKQAALFLPSGTMANLVALLTHAPHGAEVLCDPDAHTLSSELGGITAVAGLLPRTVPADDGAMRLDVLEQSIRKAGPNQSGAGLIWLENSHNNAGGTVLSAPWLQGLHALAQSHRLPVHMDGARLFNAAAASRRSAAEIAVSADSVCFCLSKGLSAPVGSLLCGTAAFIETARARRRMLGGNMRQAGPLAAAGLVALESMRERLVEDHTTARAFAARLHEIDARCTDPARVVTNIVQMSVRHTAFDAPHWSAALAVRGVRVSPANRHTLRFVTHRHIDAAAIEEAIAAIEETQREFETKR